jgi:hypothetical protein
MGLRAFFPWKTQKCEKIFGLSGQRCPQIDQIARSVHQSFPDCNDQRSIRYFAVIYKFYRA